MVYVVGGNDGQSILDTVEIYDMALQQVKQFPRMFEKRENLAVIQDLEGKIYAIGGFGGANNSTLNSVERYNPIFQRWEKIASLNSPRQGLSAISLSNDIYAIGGFDGTSNLGTVER